MFVGHYAVALAAKATQPRAPLWTYMTACQLLDFGWSALVMAGVEKVRVDPSLSGSALDLFYMPFTHSLPGALAWSVAGAVLAGLALRLPRAATVVVGLVVFSHWALDLLVHRPDLDLGNGVKVGLGLWNFPVPEMTLEMGLLAVAGAAWTMRIKSTGEPAWPAAVLLALLVLLQIVAELTPPQGAPASFAGMILIVYVVVALVSLAFDRPRSARP